MTAHRGCRLSACLAALFIAGATIAHAADATIRVTPQEVIGKASRLLTGACIEDVNHEIYGGIDSQMIFGESFQEPASLAPIANFDAYGGVWRLRDGEMQVEAKDGPKLVCRRPAFGDGSVGVEIFLPTKEGQNAGLIVRVNNPALGADRFTGYEVALYADRQVLLLGRHRENFEPIKEYPLEVAVGRWIPLEVRLTGTVIEVLVDGKLIAKHDDGKDALAAGTFGLRAWHRTARYRKLWVKTGDKPESIAFEQDSSGPAVSGMWRPVQRGTAAGRYSLTTDKPFAGVQSQRLTFESGAGQLGIENQGLNRWGMNIVASVPYEGFVWARADKPVELVAALESRDGSKVYAHTTLKVSSSVWEKLPMRMIPAVPDRAGRFTLSLKEPGTVDVGYVLLQPGESGRFKNLPVRRDVALGLIEQGVTVLRYGGSMVNHAGYRWKNMLGPRDQRPPYEGTWYRYSSNGWGILDFMDFCEAAGFEYIPAFNMDESPQDMADFIEYAKGPADSTWGKQRVTAAREKPYRLKYLQLGNEERVDDAYFAKFKPLAEAIWARDPDIILVVGDFAYEKPLASPFHIEGAASGINSLAAHWDILRLAKQHNREVWFDVHVWTDHPVTKNASLDGMFSFADALEKLADGARHKVAVFEFNSGNHAQKRALANAQALNAIANDGRVPVVCVANCLQPDGQNDNDWNQGLLFLNPSQVWLQPPGYLTQMLSRNYLPQQVRCEVQGADAKLSASAQRDDSGTLVLCVVNPTGEAISAAIHLDGYVPKQPVAQVTELAGAWDAANTAREPNAIVPQPSQWPHKFTNGETTRAFVPNSITILRIE